MQQRTPLEIRELKSQWLQDPIWDLFETEGFEAHKQELSQYQSQAEDAWKFRAECAIEKKAQDLGVKGNTALAKHVMALEERIGQLERSKDASRSEPEESGGLSVTQMERWIQANETYKSAFHWKNRPRFVGEVVAISDGLLQQKVNRNGDTVCHALAKMQGEAKVGDLAEVSYFVGGCDIFVKQPEKDIAR